MQALHLAFQLPLGDGDGGVVGLQLGQLVLAVGEVQLGLGRGEGVSGSGQEVGRLVAMCYNSVGVAIAESVVSRCK